MPAIHVLRYDFIVIINYNISNGCKSIVQISLLCMPPLAEGSFKTVCQLLSFDLLCAFLAANVAPAHSCMLQNDRPLSVGVRDASAMPPRRTASPNQGRS